MLRIKSQGPARSLILVGLVTLSLPALANNFIDQAEQLANLRAEVTRLANELRDEQSHFQNRVRSLENQRGDLELQVRRESTQLDTIDAQIQELESAFAPTAQQEELKTTMLLLAEELRKSVLQSLPYRHKDRLSAIDDITTALIDSTISAQQAATRLWAVAEDERRLNQENILDKQSIEINGQTLLVETARIGLIAMYYQQPNGSVGAVHQQGTEWRWEPLSSQPEQEQVQLLFLNLKKGIRTGKYTLPYAMVGP